MNWLDIIFIIISLILLVGGIVISVLGAIDGNIEVMLLTIPLMLIVLFFTMLCPFLVMDKGNGATIGIITSIDNNFFGTTAIYIKTSETSQEKYCIENKEVVEQAKELIGKKVKVYYGTRVGLYSTGACQQAPIEKIEEVK